MKKYIKPIVIALIAFLVIAQFFPIDKTNPTSDQSLDFITLTNPPLAIAHNLEIACYDCHSNQSKYPWYTNVAPISWWIKGHIDNGRKHLNFSNWGEYKDGKKDHKLDECIDLVEKNWMPLLTYKIAHPDSKMSEEERMEMIAFFKSLQ